MLASNREIGSSWNKYLSLAVGAIAGGIGANVCCFCLRIYFKNFKCEFQFVIERSLLLQKQVNRI